MTHTYGVRLVGILVSGVMFCLIFASASAAQIATTATLNGTVTDSSGAVIPQASIVVTNEGTGVSRTLESNADGRFALPGLTIGTYTVVVTKQGFQKYTVTGIILRPESVTSANPVLTVGSVTSEVTVSASATQVQTSSHEVAGLVTSEAVNDLPINGRDYQQLAAMMPGVLQQQPDTAQGVGIVITSTLSVNGTGQGGAVAMVDGAWSNNASGFVGRAVVPSPDSIQAVRVMQNNYSVQYTTLGAAVVNVETKSGTNKFHGSLYEYIRNDAFDARNFFSKNVPELKMNTFGGTLGGPIKLHRDSTPKTFFFLSTDWRPQRLASTIQLADPTRAIRQGIFDTPIKNPVTGQLFPQIAPGQYQIPPSMINPNAVLLMNATTDLPNQEGGGFLNYVNTAPNKLSYDQNEIKIDHDFGNKFRLMGEYLNLYEKYLLAGSPYTVSKNSVDLHMQIGKLQGTWMISPSMVNTINASTSPYVVYVPIHGIHLRSQLPGFSEELPFKGGFGTDRLPTVSFAGGWTGFGPPGRLDHDGSANNTLSDDWSWLHGNHFVQAGINFIRSMHRQPLQGPANGSWYFSGQFTGHPIADYLLGDATTFTQLSSETRSYARWINYTPYFQDRWKPTRRLTLTAGARLYYMPIAHAQPGINSSFNPALYNPAQAPIVNPDGTITPTANYNPLNGVEINGVNGVPLNFQPASSAHKWYVAPVIGFAADVFGDGKTALRGGYGTTYYNMSGSNDCSYSCSNNIPLVRSITLSFPSPTGPFPSPTGGQPPPPAAPSFGGNSSYNLQAALVQTFSLTLEHEFRGNWVASVAGAGLAGRHAAYTNNINQPPHDPPYDFNPNINNPSVFPYVYAPYQGYGPIMSSVSQMTLNWDALEIAVRHPVGHDLFLNIAYTWSHDIGTDSGASNFSNCCTQSPPQDQYNRKNNYGNTPGNVPQQLNFQYIWNIPVAKDARGWRGATLGGWRYAGMTTMQSGASIAFAGLSTSNPGLATRPNRVLGSSTKGPKTVQEWFNTAAFTAPPPGFFGNAAPGSIQAPNCIDFDMALYKDFRVKESGKIEFRVEFFNVFNHPIFAQRQYQAGIQTSFGAPNFGAITGAGDPRIMELALRYNF